MNDIEKDLEFVGRCRQRVLTGETLCEDELYAIADIDSAEGREAIIGAAEDITKAFVSRHFDTCSIVNARSGRCSENCKWCAQSAHFNTGCDVYEVVGKDDALHVARYNARNGVGRYSLVASGRSLKGCNLDAVCDILNEIKEIESISTCASLGLLGEVELQRIYDAGVRRYHCNLETAPSYFPTLCSTHTQEDKMRTIDAAHRLGFEVCSGGIIGMGETRRQRMELAIKLREAKPVSIPINILSPIPGTPLQDTPPISDDEILLTVAFFRFAHPHVTLRFAGGRARLSREVQLRAMKIGVNGAIVGDLLTTIGSTIAQDKCLAEDAGYKF